MSSGPHLNTRRAALRPAGHGLDIPALVDPNQVEWPCLLHTQGSLSGNFKW